MLTLLFLVSAVSLQANERKEVMAAQNRMLRAFAILYTNYADKLDPLELSQAAIEGMTDELDPYTVYLEHQQKFRMDMITRGEYGGVGIQIGMRSDTLSVISPMEDSPAWKAGIQPGDRIMRIDSLWTRGGRIDDLAEKIRGPAGSQVELTIWRGLSNSEIVFSLTRGTIEVREIPFAGFIGDRTGYVKLNGFSRHAAEQFRAIADSLNREGMDRIILDLRNNTGGLLDQAVEVLNVFLPKGERVVYTRGLFHGANRDFKLQKDPVLDSDDRVAILVNHGSASASEIVAGAVQDLDRGLIIGRSSFGKGLVQNIFPLDDSSSIKVTTSKYFIPSGRMIQKRDYFSDSQILKESAESSEIYRSRGGRELPNSGGIVPDSSVVSAEIHPFVVDLWRKFMFTDFAREYMMKYPDFTDYNSDARYFSEFEAFLSRRDYRFETPLEKKLDELEKDYEELQSDSETAFREAFRLLRKELNTESSDLLSEHRADIVRFLAAEMAAFYGGQKGRVEQTVGSDETVQTALQLLQNDEYLQRLGIQPFNE